MQKIVETEYSTRERIMKILKWLIIVASVIGFYILYTVFNPYEVAFFPKCPFLYLTGFKCPGCGSQRAMHFIFNFDILNAAKENFLLVVSIPYLIVGAYFDLIKIKTEKQLRIRKKLFGLKAIKLILFIVISYWIIRNFA